MFAELCVIVDETIDLTNPARFSVATSSRIFGGTSACLLRGPGTA